MKLLTGEARDLLLELIEHKDYNLAKYLAKKFEGLDFNQDDRLRATIKYLIDNGYLNIPKNGWAENVPYQASLTYEGEHYLELEMNRRQRESAPHHEINVSGEQVNIALNQATIYAPQQQTIDIETLAKLIVSVKSNMDSLPTTDIEIVNENLEVIKTELSQTNPEKGLIGTALTVLQKIKGTTEFIAAVATLVQFVQAIAS